MSHSFWLARNVGDEFLDLFVGNKPLQTEGYWSGAEIPGCVWMSRVAPGSVGIKVCEGGCVKVQLVEVPMPLDVLEAEMKADPEPAETIGRPQSSTKMSSEQLAALTQANT